MEGEVNTTKQPSMAGWLRIILGMVLAVSLGGVDELRAQIGGSHKLVPVLWNNGKVYFLQGNEYTRYDVASDRVDEKDDQGNPYPRPIQGNWPGLFTEDIDAAVFWPAPPPHGGEPKTVAYFFKGNRFMRYDVTADRADAADGAGTPYPQSIALKWPGIWTDRVDAVVVWPVPRNGRTVAYFFRGNQYIRFDVKNHRADPGYPKPIAGNWPNFKFPDGVDGVVAWPDKIEGKSVIYFFKGNQYMRYGVEADRGDDRSEGGLNYPALIAGNWPGLLRAQVEVEINQTAAETDDYVTWAPTFSRARIKPGTWGGPDLSVVLTNDPPVAGVPSGDVLFDAFQTPWPPNTTATADTLPLTLPADSSWMSFVIAGKFGRPSTTDKDAVIEVHETTAAGPVVGKKSLMVRIRKNANALTAPERDRFLRAMKELRNRGEYFIFQETHRLAVTVMDRDQAHHQPGFLPWHRAFLTQVERALQAIDPSVTIPYWNWDDAAPNVFIQDFMGAGAGGSGPVAEPLFALSNPLNGWRTDLRYAAGQLRRQRWDQTVAPASSLPFRTLTGPTGLVSFAEFGPQTGSPGQTLNDTFSARVEQESHDLAHAWNCGFGHSVNPNRSAADPLFYLLHSQVDRQWAFWQQRHGRHGVSVAGSLTFPAPAHFDNTGRWDAAGVIDWWRGSFADDTMWPWDGTAGPSGPDARGERPVPQASAADLLDPVTGENVTAGRPMVPRTFPPSSVANLWPAGATAVLVRDVIDYLGKHRPQDGLGYAYDDVPY